MSQQKVHRELAAGASRKGRSGKNPQGCPAGRTWHRKPLGRGLERRLDISPQSFAGMFQPNCKCCWLQSKANHTIQSASCIPAESARQRNVQSLRRHSFVKRNFLKQSLLNQMRRGWQRCVHIAAIAGAMCSLQAEHHPRHSLPSMQACECLCPRAKHRIQLKMIKFRSMV